MIVELEEIKKQFPSFDNDLINKIAEVTDIKYFNEGNMLMKTGQPIRSTILILEGLVKVFREDDEGNEFFMYYLSPGQACALSMICATKQETSQVLAVAVENVKVLSIPIHYMDDLMLHYKNWYYFVLETYRNRFEELLLTIDHIAFRNMDERLLFYLKRQQASLHKNIFSIPFSEIARELNSSREVISRLMKKLSDKGKIKLHRNTIEIINLELS
jgi:CRP/FNR family transcriptional regulator